MDRRDLFSDIGFACSARLCHVASGDFDAHSGFSSPVGSPSTDCALDDPDLALCFRHRRAYLFNALHMVSAVKIATSVVCTVLSGLLARDPDEILHSGSSCCLIRTHAVA